MNIGNVKIKNRVVVGPMAGISNSAFRRIAKEMGAGLIVGEMVSDMALYYDSKKTKDMLYMTEGERPISQQIFGSDIETMVNAIRYINKTMRPDIIDINMGCPMPKVVKTGAGAALLRDPKKIFDLVSTAVKVSDVPITVKIRSGWDKAHINAPLVAKTIEKAGASAITIHPRTRSELYTGHSDWNIIREVKKCVSIPVIGNGDIKSPSDAKRMIDETGCDFVMISRGVLGNPWLIRDTVRFLNGEDALDPPTYMEKLDMIRKHLNYLLETNPEERACKQMRMHISHYLKGMPYSDRVKEQIYKITDKNSFLDILYEYEKKLKADF